MNKISFIQAFKDNGESYLIPDWHKVRKVSILAAKLILETYYKVGYSEAKLILFAVYDAYNGDTSNELIPFPTVTRSNGSKGEKQTEKLLRSMGIKYSCQKTFRDCKRDKLLRFDFEIWINGRQGLIEYNGKQHYQPIEYFNGLKGYKKQVENDNIKKKYASDNDIPLLIIPYYMDVKNSLTEFITNFFSIPDKPKKAQPKQQLLFSNEDA